MDLTSEDVQDILKLLDDLPFGEMRLETSRFTLVLRRAPAGGWTQETEVRSEPAVLPAAPAAGVLGAEEASGTGAGAGHGASGAGHGASGAGRRAAGAGHGASGAGHGASGAGHGAAGAGLGATGAGAEDGAAGGLPADGEADSGAADGLVVVRAPLPGTFYRAPRPGAPPFVEVGSSVEPDTVVGIVETMKLMNSVSAGVSGTVERIVLANAQAAEKDAVLMTIREDR
jgi:acetyl-CoA carboxylase biotin carboxyl carrier protein